MTYKLGPVTPVREVFWSRAAAWLVLFGVVAHGLRCLASTCSGQSKVTLLPFARRSQLPPRGCAPPLSFAHGGAFHGDPLLLFPDFSGGPVILLCSGFFSGTCCQLLGLGLESRPLRLRIGLHVSSRENERERQHASPRTQSPRAPTTRRTLNTRSFRVPAWRKACASGDATSKYVIFRWTLT